MKTTIYVLASMVSCLAFVPLSLPALDVDGESGERPGIAVPIFTNMTGSSVARVGVNGGVSGTNSAGLMLPDNAREIATDEAKDALAECGLFRVCDYSPLIEREINDKRMKEHVDDYVVMTDQGPLEYLLVGRINNYRVVNERYTVYGVSHHRITVTVTLDMKLINAVQQQEVKGHEAMKEKFVREIPEGVEIEGTDDEWEEILRKAVRNAMPKFIAKIRRNIASDSGISPTSSSPASVSFEVKSTPEGADVEYNDSFVGNTPCTVTAPASPGILRVSLAGYKTWEKKLTPSENMRISPILQKIETPVIVPKKSR